MCDRRPCDKPGCAKEKCESLSPRYKPCTEPCDFSPCITTCRERAPTPPFSKPPCSRAAPPPDLRHINPEDRKAFRQCKIQQWLDNMVARAPRECFGHYIGRVYAVASRELNFDAQARTCIGDEFPHFVDRFAWRILHGSRLNMQKHGISIGHNVEQQNLALLREECEELFKEGQILPDPTMRMSMGDTWVHEGDHCSSSRAGRDCQVEAHQGNHEPFK